MLRAHYNDDAISELPYSAAAWKLRPPKGSIPSPPLLFSSLSPSFPPPFLSLFPLSFPLSLPPSLLPDSFAPSSLICPLRYFLSSPYFQLSLFPPFQSSSSPHPFPPATPAPPCVSVYTIINPDFLLHPCVLSILTIPSHVMLCYVVL